ncbi:MAG: tRNA pseudouridine(55) synthase TruB [Actinomycetes bacterium]
MARGPRERTAADGIVVVDKPSGMTSHDVVSRMRRFAGTRKVGHAGTLDPMATGVLIVGVERATRLLGHLMLTDKTYDATIRLGVATHTDDAEGEVLENIDAAHITDEAIRHGVQALTGSIMQRPSSVSAIKVDGVRSYDRVRAGEEIVLPERRATISRFEIHQISRAESTVDVDVTVDCSSGTYIRALARDLGAGLNVGGHLTALRRTRVGAFTINQAHSLEQLEQDCVIIPLADVVRETFPSISVDASDVDRVLHGSRIPIAEDSDGIVGIFGPDGRVLSIAEPREGVYAHLVVFS